MEPFTYTRARSVDEALAAMADSQARFLAGGTNLLDLMKGGIERPARIVDINRVPLADIESLPDGGLRIGALVRNSDLAWHPAVRDRYPMLTQALLAGASPQLRNMATVGGNLMQRTRCYYFTDVAFPACNKRVPGSGCSAREGYNRIHAIFGASEQCVATHPSDMCVALAALDALVEAKSSAGTRRIAFNDFHRLPGGTPDRDTNLRRDELIVAVVLPPTAAGSTSHYLKVRDRTSYAFALVSVAASVRVSEGRVAQARIALGGVAHKPWRATAAEQALVGKPLDAVAIDAAGEAAAAGARPLQHNAFKVALVQRSVARALRVAGGVA